MRVKRVAASSSCQNNSRSAREIYVANKYEVDTQHPRYTTPSIFTVDFADKINSRTKPTDRREFF